MIAIRKHSAQLFFAALLIVFSNFAHSQHIDDGFPQESMRKDLAVFKEIRQEANSGLYKYRTKAQIDSIYTWAEKQIDSAISYLDFYNIICKLTDFEGSLHNHTDLPKQHWKSLRKESTGYFPYPIIWVDNSWRINIGNQDIPLGAELVSINQTPIKEVVRNLYKYFTTDGLNTTGKRIGLHAHFPRYYRWHYGLSESFFVEFRIPGSNHVKITKFKSIGSSSYYKNYLNRHSKAFDEAYAAEKKKGVKYKYNQTNESTGNLTIHTFDMGDESSSEHARYCSFLDSIFLNMKTREIQNLIVDVRRNGGGTDPNDVVTYSYLTSRSFQESKQAWISFRKVPLLKYYNSPFPAFLRPLGVGKFNRNFRRRYPNEIEGRFHISSKSMEMMLREPSENSFTGNIYLLISPRVASAGSLFAAMLAGNDNVITIGEETMGGFYGHNGHIEFSYVLPESKLITSFFIDNIEQDVEEKSNQIYGRGIMPDVKVSQSYTDYLNHEDTQLNYVLDMIKSDQVKSQ